MSDPKNLSVSTYVSLVINLISFNLVLGCGQFPQGEVTAMTFTASGFTLPVEMVYSENAVVQNEFSSISHKMETAKKIVENLIMNAVTDVLQEQGRRALLPDVIISSILQQLTVTIEYTPLQCKTATKEKTNMPISAMKDGCFIIDDMVTSLCMMDMIMRNGRQMPGCTLMPIMSVEPIPADFRTIKGSLRTSNAIMGNWSKHMWQSVLNRVYQRIATGQFGKYFSTTIVDVN